MTLQKWFNERIKNGDQYKIIVLNIDYPVSEDYLLNNCLFIELQKTEIKDNLHIAYINI